MKNKFIIVCSTFSSLKEARQIAQTLVKEKLAACANISSPVESIYVWKNKLCKEKEFLIQLKTTTQKYPTLEKRLKSLHSYEVPEIIALPVLKGNSHYLEWIWKTLLKKS